MFNRVIIIGLGLIGGSIAKDIRKNKLAAEIWAYDLNKIDLDFALEHKIFDQIYDFNEKIAKEDLVIIATPIHTYAQTARLLLPVLNKDNLIIDVGSVKEFVEIDILPILKDFASNFVPCHPIAGLEKSGVQNSINDLFLGKKLIITPTKICSEDSVKTIEIFWQKIGCKIEILDAATHDKIFALTSHLPQWLSLFLKHNSNSLVTENPILKRHARLEDSSLKIWADIFRYNRNNLNHYLNEYVINVEEIRLDIVSQNYEILISKLKKSVSVLNLKEEIKEDFDGDFKKIFSRILVVCSLVLISDLKKFQDYFGSGFKDFTIILIYLNYLLQNSDLLILEIKHNQEYLQNFLSTMKEIKT